MICIHVIYVTTTIATAIATDFTDDIAIGIRGPPSGDMRHSFLFLTIFGPVDQAV